MKKLLFFISLFSFVSVNSQTSNIFYFDFDFPILNNKEIEENLLLLDRIQLKSWKDFTSYEHWAYEKASKSQIKQKRKIEKLAHLSFRVIFTFESDLTLKIKSINRIYTYQENNLRHKYLPKYNVVSRPLFYTPIEENKEHLSDKEYNSLLNIISYLISKEVQSKSDLILKPNNFILNTSKFNHFSLYEMDCFRNIYDLEKKIPFRELEEQYIHELETGIGREVISFKINHKFDTKETDSTNITTYPLLLGINLSAHETDLKTIWVSLENHNDTLMKEYIRTAYVNTILGCFNQYTIEKGL